MAAVNDVSLFYARFGHGPPVLLLHGGLGNSNYWGYLIPALVGRGFEVIVADSRGHGRSTRSDRPFSYELMASDVIALLDYLKLRQVDLVGWSDGGIIGLVLAINDPERIRRLAVYGTNSDPSGIRDGFEKRPAFAAYIVRAQHEYSLLSPSPLQWDGFLSQISIMWAQEPRISRAELATIKAPTLVFDGAHDEAIKPEHSIYLARTIPGARSMLLPTVSHFGMIQDPEPFNQAVLNFLQRP